VRCSVSPLLGLGPMSGSLSKIPKKPWGKKRKGTFALTHALAHSLIHHHAACAQVLSATPGARSPKILGALLQSNIPLLFTLTCVPPPVLSVTPGATFTNSPKHFYTHTVCTTLLHPFPALHAFCMCACPLSDSLRPPVFMSPPGKKRGGTCTLTLSVSMQSLTVSMLSSQSLCSPSPY
jgi:hypothetical protein